jgi:hypothetical protein
MNCATRRARGFVVQGDQLYHRVGQNYAGWWRAVVTNATGVHTTYGPYATAITGDAIAWTAFGASPGWFGAPAGTNATLRWSVEVYDAAQSASLNSVSYSRTYDPSGFGFPM